MIGKLYNKILTSERGQSFFDIDTEGNTIEWTEDGIGSFIFWNVLIQFGLFFGILSIIFSFSPRMLISILLLSLYTTEKSRELFVEVLDSKEGVTVERRKPVTETRKFKIMRSIFNGVDVRESFRRHD